MIVEILANVIFELKIRYRSLSSYVYYVMFFSLSLLMTLAAGGAFQGVTVSFGTSSRVFVNAPLTITMYVGLLGAFQLFIIAPVFGQAVCKDFINNMDQIIFTCPIKIRNFLVGRFLGAAVFLMWLSTSVPLGVYIAAKLPFVLPSMLGPNSFVAYVWPLLIMALPNILLFGAIFFAIGAKSKKMAPVYIAATLLFLLWSASGQILNDIDNRTIGAMIDPLGLRAAALTFRYWTVEQQNYQLLSVESYFLLNRLLWLAVGLIAFVFSLVVFSRKSRATKKVQAQSTPVVDLAPAALAPLKPLSLATIPWWPVFWRQVQFEFKQTVKSIYFLVILLAGVGYMLIVGGQVGKMFGTPTYPVTYNVLDFMGGTFSLFMLVIITLYVGESVWRDRDLHIDQIIDALPVPNAVLIAAKYLNMLVITAIMLSLILVTGMIVQTAYGYTNYEIGLYLMDLYLVYLPNYLNVIALIFFFQVMFRNKYVAHGLMVAYYLFHTFAGAMGFEHYLYRFNAAPTPTYSDMNGYGSLFKIYHLFNTYWMFLSVMLMLAAYLFWHRGTAPRAWSYTLPKVSRRMTMPIKVSFALAFLGFVGMGSYLFYQTNMVNTYITAKDTESQQLNYEKKYKAEYSSLAQPEFTSVLATVDIFPEKLQMKGKLNIKLQNKTKSPIDKIFVNVPKEKWTLTFSVPADVVRDEALDVAIYKLHTPLAAGQEITAEYAVDVDASSIENGTNVHRIRENGSFFGSDSFFPTIGYSASVEIGATKTREKYGLASKPRRPSIDDESERAYNYLDKSASWIEFEAVVSTTPDQIAIAPGYLQKEWEENGRRYFHYKMDQKIINFYAFLSGRYEVHRDKWNDVNIEVYYHKGHEYNIERFINSTKRGLDYFTKNFGPYQHKQYRIIEFPRYQSFAQAFPNTIPYSEAIGFITRIDDSDEDDIDNVFYVNAHELAHQWWAHQLIGANVQGSEMLSESFSQYSALMVMEKEYGREKMKKFLKYELDQYLFGRGKEGEYENPLFTTEKQGYIHYNKGSVIFYALKEYLGEDRVNSAIRNTLTKYGKRAAPYPTTREFLAELKAGATPVQVALIEDMLEKIVVFENRPLTAQAVKVSGDTYQVELDISAKKMYSDKNGKEEPKDFAQEMEIGVLDKDKKYIYLKKHLIKNGETKLKLEVKGEPSTAGVDPRNILIDRISSDNVMKVSMKTAAAPVALDTVEPTVEKEAGSKPL